MTAVDLATVHHEGAGVPRDDLSAPGTKGYVVGLGLTKLTWFRPPSEAFATFGYNHRSFDILISGDRNLYPLTANDYDLLRVIAAQGRQRGWLVDRPYVRPHRETPMNFTICPGNNVAYPDPPRWPGNALAWVGVVSALTMGEPPVIPAVPPEFSPPLPPFVSWCIFVHPTLGRCAVAVDSDGHVFCDPPNAYLGGPYDDKTGAPKFYWGDRQAATVEPANLGYTITSTNAGHYTYPES